MKKLMCMLLCVLLLPAFAAADCETHGYAPYDCLCSRSTFPDKLVCLSCGTMNEGFEACPECGGDGLIDCACEDGRWLTSAVQCEQCHGLGGDLLKGTDCRYCERGWNWIYEDCSSCINGYKSCLITRVRTMRCSACGAGALRCRLCYDAPEASPCPDCEPDAYADFVYRKVMREPEKHLNACFRISGRIQRAETIHEDEAGKVIDLTLTEEDAAAGVAYTYRVHYFAPAGAMNLLMGDQVTLWGRLVAHTSDQTPQFNVWQAELAE